MSHDEIEEGKHNRIKLSNNIRGITYLGELEKFITPVLREDIKGAFYRIDNFSITNTRLTFYYSLPIDPTDFKTMILTKNN